MRSRKSIEESFKDITAPAGQAELYRIVVDLLLDIRGFLDTANRFKQEERVRQARESVEEKRKRNVINFIKEE